MHPFTQIESLFADNRITNYEVQRAAGKYRISFDFLEFDEDSPEGSPSCTSGCGATLALALVSAMRNLPAVQA